MNQNKKIVNKIKVSMLERSPNIIGEETIRKYAVLVPFVKEDDGWYLIFEKRNSKLRKHPGEICFPGGKLEKDETLLQCAIRETMEELLLLEEDIQVFGVGDMYLSPFQILVQPFLAEFHEYKNSFSEDEVAEVLKIPLDFFLGGPVIYNSVLSHQPPEDFPYEWIPGGIDYPWIKGNYNIHFYKYGEHVIWGMTAHIITSVIGLLKEYQMILVE